MITISGAFACVRLPAITENSLREAFTKEQKEQHHPTLLLPKLVAELRSRFD
jgi:hypothetical protein